MALRNPPESSTPADLQAGEDRSALDRLLEHRKPLAIAAVVVVIVFVVVTVIRRAGEASEQNAWRETTDLRMKAVNAIATANETSAAEALRELEPKIDGYRNTSVHPWLLYYKARLQGTTDDWAGASATFEQLTREHPDHPFSDASAYVPGDKPLGALEAESAKKRLEFYEKHGKPFASRPTPKEGLTVTLSFKDYGDVKLGFFPDVAPRHVANFVRLAKEGFYDGTTIHRITDFGIEGGCPNTKNDDALDDGKGDPGYAVEKEIFLNPTLHTKGTLSATAPSQSEPDNGSQWFLCTKDAPARDGANTPFGEVIAGMDVVEKIFQERVEGPNEKGIAVDRPVAKIVIEKVAVEGEFTLPPGEMPGPKPKE